MRAHLGGPPPSVWTRSYLIADHTLPAIVSRCLPCSEPETLRKASSIFQSKLVKSEVRIVYINLILKYQILYIILIQVGLGWKWVSNLTLIDRAKQLKSARICCGVSLLLMNLIALRTMQECQFLANANAKCQFPHLQTPAISDGAVSFAAGAILTCDTPISDQVLTRRVRTVSCACWSCR